MIHLFWDKKSFNVKFFSGIPWIVTAGSKVEMPLDQFEDFLKTNSSLKHYIGKEVSSEQQN
jgi:hypothetical protein